MAKATIAEIRKANLKKLPKDGSADGNQSLQKRIVEQFDTKVKDDCSQESTTTSHLAILNLAIRDVEADIGKEHAGTIRNAQHPDLRLDYILANSSFNDSDWFIGNREAFARVAPCLNSK